MEEGLHAHIMEDGVPGDHRGVIEKHRVPVSAVADVEARYLSERRGVRLAEGLGETLVRAALLAPLETLLHHREGLLRVLASASETKDGAILAAETREPHIVRQGETGAAHHRAKALHALVLHEGGGGIVCHRDGERTIFGEGSGECERYLDERSSRRRMRECLRSALLPAGPNDAAVERRSEAPRGRATASDLSRRFSEGFLSACAAEDREIRFRALAVSRRVRQPNVPRADFRKEIPIRVPRSAAGGPRTVGSFRLANGR